MKQTEMIKLPRPAIDEILKMAVELKILREENKMLRESKEKMDLTKRVEHEPS